MIACLPYRTVRDELWIQKLHRGGRKLRKPDAIAGSGGYNRSGKRSRLRAGDYVLTGPWKAVYAIVKRDRPGRDESAIRSARGRVLPPTGGALSAVFGKDREPVGRKRSYSYWGLATGYRQATANAKVARPPLNHFWPLPVAYALFLALTADFSPYRNTEKPIARRCQHRHSTTP